MVMTRARISMLPSSRVKLSVWLDHLVRSLRLTFFDSVLAVAAIWASAISRFLLMRVTVTCSVMMSPSSRQMVMGFSTPCWR